MINPDKSKLIEKGKLNSLPESSETIEKLENLKKELEKIREKIKENNLLNLKITEYDEIKKEFKKAYKEFDIAKNGEDPIDFNLDIKKSIGPKIFKYLLTTNEIQTLISRIASKFQSFDFKKQEEIFKKTTKEYDLLKEEASNIKKETSNLRDNVLTVSSIIFTAFTLIQLNFVAFQNSNDYNVLDRLILFSGINLFLIISITAIMSIIKKLLSLENKKNLFFSELSLVLIILFLLFGGALFFKYHTKNILVDEEKILNMEIKIKELEEKITSTLNNNNIILEENKNLKNEINTLKDKTIDLKEKISDLKK
jgi:hypothetical protein